MFAGKAQPDAAINQQRSKKVENPVEALDQADAGKNKDAAHQHRPDNSPEQYPMLMLLGHGEITEDQEEDKKIIDAEREFENVAGDELIATWRPCQKKTSPAKAAARPIHIALQASASRERITRPRRWKTRMSSTSMPSAKRLKRIQK